MAFSKKRLTASLEKLALSDLRRRFEQETGETNRTPNRAFLIRRIVEAASVASPATVSETGATPPVLGLGALQEQPPTMAQAGAMPGISADSAPAPPPPLLAAPEDEAEGGTHGGPASTRAAHGRTRDGVRLERGRGTATVLDNDAEPERSEGGRLSKVSAEGGSPPRMARGALTALTVMQLQAKYVEVVGRPTGSSDKAYLVWKIREAFKGKVPRGPRIPRQRAAQESDVMVLPLRLPTMTVSAMDHVWHSLGIRTRTDFLRDAIRLHLERLNAPDVAARFARA